MGAVTTNQKRLWFANAPESKAWRSRTFRDAKVERLAQRIGHGLLHSIARHEPSRLNPARVPELLLRLMMRDDDLRYRLLRFVGVYPALHSQAAISQQLEEYLESDALASGCARTTLSAAARRAGHDRRATRWLTALASRYAIHQMGKMFIAGDSPAEVGRRVRGLEREGFLFSLDLLGEFVASEAQADDYQRRYLELIEGFEDRLVPERGGESERENGPRVNISVKLSSLTSHFDPMNWDGTNVDVRRRLRKLLRAAITRDVFINVDMEKYEYRDLTLQIVLDLLDEPEFRGTANLGIVHQAYLVDAEPTLRAFLTELEARRQPMTIRLVKGAYWDSEQVWARQKGWPVPVFLDKRDTDASWERCARILLERHSLVRTAIASHNARSVAWALALRRAYHVPRGRLEFQMLYGMAGPMAKTLVDAQLPVRIYAPCGELVAGMGYLVRRILENTSNESFLRQRFAEHTEERILLSNPKDKPGAWTEATAPA